MRSTETSSSGFVLSALALHQQHHSQRQTAELGVFLASSIWLWHPSHLSAYLCLHVTLARWTAPGFCTEPFTGACNSYSVLFQGSGANWAMTLQKVFCQKKLVASWAPHQSPLLPGMTFLREELSQHCGLSSQQPCPSPISALCKAFAPVSA